MKILGIESAAMTASAALLKDDAIVCEYTTNFKKTHSQTLLPMIRSVMEITETAAKDVDVFAVSEGPGSFTGLRIGAATVKGLAYAADKPVVGVPTLAAMAYACHGSQYVLCPMMDARRTEVYTALYRFDGEAFICLKESCCLPVREIVAEAEACAAETGSRVLYLGDGADVYKELILSTAAAAPVFAPAHMKSPRASAVAEYGRVLFEQGKAVSAFEFEPVYLKKSQAEQEREAAGLATE